MRNHARFAGFNGLAVAFAIFAAPAHATVDDAGANGFAVTETADIAASPDQVYQAVITPSRWWDPDHTYSHDAANLTLEAKAGGCWCETLPGGGSVQHLVVVNAMPGNMIRMRGALGPLQAMAVDGAMTVSLHAVDKITRLTMTYTIGGYARGGFADVAKAVDNVLGEQVNRLKRFIENGSPDASLSPAK